jgi:hypothetical protein
MYSVSHHSESSEVVTCAGKAAPSCAQQHAVTGGPKLLRSSCVTKEGIAIRGCIDSTAARDSSGEIVIKSRTDSASLALIAKKEKPRTSRPNRGFIR